MKAAFAATVFVLALLASLCLGAAPIGPLQAMAALLSRIVPLSGVDPVSVSIVWELRLARTLLAGTAGAALGASGAVLQGLFRNPLADPYSLGVSSGAALGAVAALSFGIASPVASIGAVQLLAFIGALVTALVVYLAAKSGRTETPTATLLLVGTAVGSFLSALVSLIVSLNDRDLHHVFFWLLGGFGGRSWTELSATLPVAALSIVLAFLLARPLDVLGAGEEAAVSLGLSLERTRALAVAASALGAAAAVSAGGIIGFVGLIGPHAARLLVGPSHRRLVPASALAGAALLMAADTAARTVAAPLELPIGVITALVGAPVFLRLLVRRRTFQEPSA